MCTAFGRKKSAKSTVSVDYKPMKDNKDVKDLVCVKIMLLGDMAVGKTALMSRFCDQDFNPSYIETIGVDFKQTFIQHCGQNVKIQVWDTAGQERFRSLINSYYRGASGIMLVYDITSADSFKHVTRWMKNIEQYAKPDVVKCLVANKVDMNFKRMINENDGQKLAKEFNAFYVETSATLNTNVDKAFLDLTQAILDQKLPF